MSCRDYFTTFQSKLAPAETFLSFDKFASVFDFWFRARLSLNLKNN